MIKGVNRWQLMLGYPACWKTGMSIILEWKIDLARSLHGLCHNVHGCQGHCEGHAKWGPCEKFLAWTTSDEKSPSVDHTRTIFCGFLKNADTVKPWYNVSLGTEILQHYIENNDILRLFYMSTYGKGENFLNVITG
jgi:hypothetical protein